MQGFVLNRYGGAEATGLQEVPCPVPGSGDVLVSGGRATIMKVSVAGSGDVAFNGVADSMKARIAGSGDVRADKVNGDVSKMIMGSGSVRVGR